MSEQKNKKKFIIIDGNALLHRAWHALPPLTSPKGQVVNALYGFTSILLRVLREMQPDFIAVAWDRKEPTFRHKEFKEYKAQRERQPDEFYAQLDPVKKLLEILKIPSLELAGFEADDIIGSLAQIAKKGGQIESIILTGDLDALQLVDETTKVLTLRKGISDTVLYDVKAVEDRYGLRPDQLIDFKALRGDPSDNIPGVKGIGEKGATGLLQEFGNIEEIYKYLENHCAKEQRNPAPDASRRYGAGARTEKQRNRETKERYKIKDGAVKILREGKDAARLSKRLVTIVRDLKLDFKLDDARARDQDEKALYDFLVEQGFRSLADRIARTTTPKEETPEKTSAQTGLFDDKRQATSDKQKEIRILDTDSKIQAFIKETRKRGQFSFKILTDEQDPLRARVLGVALVLPENPPYFLLEACPAPNLSNAANRSVIIAAGGTRETKGALSPEGSSDFGAGAKHRPMSEVFEDTDILKIGHDLKKEYKLLKTQGIELAAPIFDCMIASYVLNPGSRTHDISSAAFRLLGKTVREKTTSREDAAEHAEAAFDLWKELSREIENQNFGKLLHDIEFALVPVLARMEMNGVLIDKDFLLIMSDKFGKRLGALTAKIHELAGAEFNISSPQQLGDVLFNKLKLLPKTGRLKRGKTGVSTAAAELEKLRGTHPVVDLLFEYRELSKLKSTYVDALPSLINPTTGRVHTTFNQVVTATGRLSSSEPNLQNIPIRTEVGREIRKSFIAPPNHVLVSADYSQIELRIAASVSNDRNMINAFNSGLDIHTATAADVWGVLAKNVTKDMRRAAKAINFGILYGIGAQGLAVSAGISFAEAKKFIEKYFVVYSGIKQYMEETKALARSLGYVETVFGRRRYLPEIVSEIPEVRAAAERMAINMPIQGSQADLIKIAMVRLNDALSKISAETKMILQVHDELVFEIPKNDVSLVAPAIREIMESAHKLKVPTIVDVRVGKNWGELEKLF